MICEPVIRKGTSVCVCVCVHGFAFNCCCIIAKHHMYSDFKLICLEQNMYQFLHEIYLSFLKEME